MNRDRRIWIQAAAGAALGSTLPARAADPYPSRSVRLIVPIGAGTTTDLVARLLAQRLSEGWGQGVGVENIPGASGVVGLQQLANAPADGYTLGAISTNFAINSALFSKLPYDPLRDFKPLLNLASNYFVFVLHPDFPAKTMQEFIAAAKAKPGQIDFASTGNGGGPHLAVEMFAHMAGIKLQHVPYKATGPAVTDVLSGRVPLMCTSISTLLPHVQSGKLRALAVTAKQRVSQMPEVPTVIEAGVPGYEFKQWVGMVAPAGLPEPIASKLQADMVKIISSADTAKQLAPQAVEVDLLNGTDFARRIREDIMLWQRVVKQSGAHVE